MLGLWLDHAERETVIGPPGAYGGKALLHVRARDERFHLNGDSRDSGVEEYLDLVQQHGARPAVARHREHGPAR